MEFKSTERLTGEELKNYWETRIEETRKTIESMTDEEKKFDPTFTSLYELLRRSVEFEQYKKVDDSVDFVEVTKMCRIRISSPRKTLEHALGIETLSLYGVGLYTPVEGIMLSSAARAKSNYDDASKKHVFLDFSFIPDEVYQTLDTRLISGALGGLFIPKKSGLTSWMSRYWQMEFFDITMR